MRAETVSQYRILQWIYKRFLRDELVIECIARNQVRITDCNGTQAIITEYKDESIEMEIC